MSSYFDIFDKSLGVIFPLFCMSFGFYEASVIHNSYDAASLCWQVWGNVLMNCIFNSIYGTTLTIKSIAISCKSLSERDGIPTGSIVLVVTSILEMILNIWTMVINNNIYDSCVDEYKDDFPELWQAFNIQIIIFFISVSMIGFTIVFGIFRCCYALHENKQNNQKNNSTTDYRNFNTV